MAWLGAICKTVKLMSHCESTSSGRAYTGGLQLSRPRGRPEDGGCVSGGSCESGGGGWAEGCDGRSVTGQEQEVSGRNFGSGVRLDR